MKEISAFIFVQNLDNATCVADIVTATQGEEVTLMRWDLFHDN